MGSSEEESDGDSEIETDVRAVEELVEDVSGDVGIIAETALLAPFEITFGFFSDFGLLVIVASIGVVWVLLWTVTVSFAKWVLASMDSLMDIFIAFATFFDIIADAWQALFFAVFYVVQWVACEFPLISQAIGPNDRNICSKTPEINFEVIPLDKDWWKTDAWRSMYKMETTCKKVPLPSIACTLYTDILK